VYRALGTTGALLSSLPAATSSVRGNNCATCAHSAVPRTTPSNAPSTRTVGSAGSPRGAARSPSSASATLTGAVATRGARRIAARGSQASCRRSNASRHAPRASVGASARTLLELLLLSFFAFGVDAAKGGSGAGVVGALVLVSDDSVTSRFDFAFFIVRGDTRLPDDDDDADGGANVGNMGGARRGDVADVGGCGSGSPTCTSRGGGTRARCSRCAARRVSSWRTCASKRASPALDLYAARAASAVRWRCARATTAGAPRSVSASDAAAAAALSGALGGFGLRGDFCARSGTGGEPTGDVTPLPPLGDDDDDAVDAGGRLLRFCEF
jgi:hypothetical protein